MYGDHLGSASVVADGNNTVLSDTRFYPFGGTRTGGVNPDVTDMGFTGHKHNDDLGLALVWSSKYPHSLLW